MSDVAIIVFAALVAITLFIMAPIMAISYYADRSRCSSWGQATNREVKFVHLVEVGVPFRWDCFTPDEGGRWIPTDRVRDID